MPQIVANVGKYVSSCPYSDAHECALKDEGRLQLILKEAVHIRWENSTLNKQLKHADLTLSLKISFEQKMRLRCGKTKKGSKLGST